jgi:hypothetical protein
MLRNAIVLIAAAGLMSSCIILRPGTIQHHYDEIRDVDSYETFAPLDCKHDDLFQSSETIRLHASSVSVGKVSRAYYMMGSGCFGSWTWLEGRLVSALADGERWSIEGEHDGSVIYGGSVCETLSVKLEPAQIEGLAHARDARIAFGSIKCSMSPLAKQALAKLLAAAPPGSEPSTTGTSSTASTDADRDRDRDRDVVDGFGRR